MREGQNTNDKKDMKRVYEFNFSGRMSKHSWLCGRLIGVNNTVFITACNELKIVQQQ